VICAVPKESFPEERRVSLVPAHVKLITSKDFQVRVERGAGAEAGFTDSAYEEQGAGLVDDRKELYGSADVVFQVRGAGANPHAGLEDISLMREGSILIGFLNPFGARESIDLLNKKKITSFAVELIPRITRAQSMDALSSMASLAGYRAALMAACALSKIYPMMMTAAGTIIPAKVFVIGAGVAGLQAIATAHRIGAVVTAYDVRPAVRDQVESLGAKFVELDLETGEAEDTGGYARKMDERFYEKQREMMSRVLAESDVVITTAAVPGSRAPVLITDSMVAGMQHGSVIVDLAAESGGNCELTSPGETVTAHGVKIIGPVNLPASMPFNASQLYSKNIASFFQVLAEESCLDVRCPDEIATSSLLTFDGELVHTKVKETLYG
jgi:NAD(P) transhydrogenase subunit alpha